MDKLLTEYERSGAIKSRSANFIWKSGVIICSIFYCINANANQNLYNILGYFGIIIILFIISEIIFIRESAKKLNIECSLKYIGKIYRKIEKYQQKWITDYCNKNKINSFKRRNKKCKGKIHNKIY